MGDLYSGHSSEIGSNSAGLAEIFSRLNRLDEKIRKAHKKKRKNGNGDKKKKWKKQRRALEFEHEQLKTFQMQHNTSRPAPTWLQDAFVKLVPKLLDVGISYYQRKSQAQIFAQPTGNQMLALSAGNDKK